MNIKSCKLGQSVFNSSKMMRRPAVYVNYFLLIKNIDLLMSYKGNRDWPEYNKKLIRRGELYFSFEFLDIWAEGLAQMNAGKVERRCTFPEAFIQHLMIV